MIYKPILLHLSFSLYVIADVSSMVSLKISAVVTRLARVHCEYTELGQINTVHLNIVIFCLIHLYLTILIRVCVNKCFFSLYSLAGQVQKA